ncbi:synaptophysin-like [Ruditapes philippinarum]|uniref:synaptophysin-like n=1 Tax=Ruditapes philippinarum TaxID=129788 RepID=UPI00295BD485|nr:synaptophysin-like [Ruditapes philippinarum]
MASAGQIFSGFNLESLKEPRGFIKPIQWILSIFAFATTTSVTLKMQFMSKCMDNGTATTSHSFDISSSYPFALEEVGFSGVVCNVTQSLNLLQGSQSPSQFYVFVGVMVFLYCLAALVMYIFCDDFYRKHNACTIGDFIISGVIVLLWLIGSSAWAQGVTDLKYYTDFEECGYFGMIADCKVAGNTCRQTVIPNFASLNVSIIFGFLNMGVWIGNMWFLYKETPWHKVQETKPPNLPGQQAQDPQRI